MQFSSQLIQDAVEEITRLPGIGKKTALRLVLHLLKQPESQSAQLSESIINLRSNIRYCKSCMNISDDEQCNICASPRRDRSLICVVEDIRDVMAIENTSQYTGLYHVLGGVISPIDGVGPSDLHIDKLLERCDQPDVEEIILALSPTMEGDTTAFYITRKLKDTNLRISTIARGIPIGGELEYADEITLGRSIQGRTLYPRD